MVTSKRAIHASKPPDDKCRRDTEINPRNCLASNYHEWIEIMYKM